jgi:hypothetical protein
LAANTTIAALLLVDTEPNRHAIRNCGARALQTKPAMWPNNDAQPVPR